MSDTLTFEDCVYSSLGEADALAKLPIEKGIITQQEFLVKIAAERATYKEILRVGDFNSGS